MKEPQVHQKPSVCACVYVHVCVRACVCVRVWGRRQEVNMWVQEVCTECTMRHLVSYVNKHQYVCWKSDYLAMQLSMLFRLQIYTNTYTHKAFDGGYYTFPNHEVDVYTLGGDLVFFGFCTPSFSTLSACKQNKQQTSPSKLSLPVNKLINKSA